MKTFLLTSKTFEGEIELVYSDDEFLGSFSMERAQLSLQQKMYFLTNLPRTRGELKEFASRSTTMALEQVHQEITFEMFWDRYDHKAVSSKKKALAAWQRLSKAHQQKAYRHISRYFQMLPPGVAKKYAETYLNSQLWDN